MNDATNHTTKTPTREEIEALQQQIEDNTPKEHRVLIIGHHTPTGMVRRIMEAVRTVEDRTGMKIDVEQSEHVDANAVVATNPLSVRLMGVEEIGRQLGHSVYDDVPCQPSACDYDDSNTRLGTAALRDDRKHWENKHNSAAKNYAKNYMRGRR